MNGQKKMFLMQSERRKVQLQSRSPTMKNKKDTEVMNSMEFPKFGK